MEFSALSDCIDAFERALLIGVYTYAEQLVKNFYYELLEKDRAENLYTRNFINKKLDVERFSPNVSYINLENSIKNELCNNFRFIISRSRDEISKYDDLIRNRHRYAHRGVFQSSVEQYRDVINAEKYITVELTMIVTHGVEYRIRYQNDWSEIGSILKSCCGLIDQFKNNKNTSLKRNLIDKIKTLRNASRKFMNKYSSEIENCVLLEEVRIQLLRVNVIDLRSRETFSVIEELNEAMIKSKLATKMIDKLKSTMSIYDAEELDRSVLGINIAKAENKKILYNVNLIQEALAKGVQISFDYMVWDRTKKLIKKSDRRYNMNPWALIWANDRYYLYGYDVKEKDGVLSERNYRVDKLDNIWLSDIPRAGKSQFRSFNANTYVSRRMGMFSGKEQLITVRIPDTLVGPFID